MSNFSETNLAKKLTDLNKVVTENDTSIFNHLSLVTLQSSQVGPGLTD